MSIVVIQRIEGWAKTDLEHIVPCQGNTVWQMTDWSADQSSVDCCQQLLGEDWP